MLVVPQSGRSIGTAAADVPLESMQIIQSLFGGMLTKRNYLE
jgi:hypothetical protein